ncbi:MAG: METTL5 family protein [Thermoplasmata archaeon]|nr:METTL5 family protein [Thermoplasmata archaeon]
MKIKNKKDLSLILSSLEKISEPKVLLEQYSTPSDIASDILFLAMDDIKDKIVADFGCGNGIFAIGAAILGAKKVYCIDIDKEMINIARKNAEKLILELEYLNMDISNFNIKVDTIIENPPFGYQLRGADLPFIEKSIEISNKFYILYDSKARLHFIRILDGKGTILMEKNYKFSLPYTFKFHREQMKEMEVTLFVVKVV